MRFAMDAMSWTLSMRNRGPVMIIIAIAEDGWTAMLRVLFHEERVFVFREAVKLARGTRKMKPE